ncbi:MAG: DM13 domain-containing protein [Armatimonadota bacterium]
MRKGLWRKQYWWIIAVLVVIGAPIAWYLGSPLFINRVVDEPFPTGGGTASSTSTFPMSKDATVPEGMTQQQVEETMMKASKVEKPADETMPPAASAKVVARGTFAGADAIHKGEGAATVYRVGEDLILRFDAFKSTNGPDLHVLLAKHAAPKSSADVKQGYIEVAKLKGNIGSQNYTLPRGITLADYRTVVIYCKPFHVVFSTAPLQAAP